MKAKFIICRSLALLAVAVVTALAWMPWPPLQHANEPWLPDPIRHLIYFLGMEDFLCNVMAFFLLAMIVLPVFSRPGRRRCALGLAGLVVLLECGQLFMPHRFFDLKDILAGWIGVGVGALPWLVPVRRFSADTVKIDAA